MLLKVLLTCIIVDLPYVFNCVFYQVTDDVLQQEVIIPDMDLDDKEDNNEEQAKREQSQLMIDLPATLRHLHAKEINQPACLMYILCTCTMYMYV